MSCSSNRRIGADSVYSPSPPPPPPTLQLPAQSPSSFATNDTFVPSPSPYGGARLYPDVSAAAASASASPNLKFREFRRLDDVPIIPQGHHHPAAGPAPPYPPHNHQFPYQRNHFPWARSDSTQRLTEVMSD